MSLVDMPSAHFTQASEWNRFALPEQFRGCVDHTPALLNQADQEQDWQRWTEHLLQSPFAHVVIGELMGSRHGQALLEAINQIGRAHV